MNGSNDPTPTPGSTPVLPYPDAETDRSSGHSGTDTSAERAHREDADGTTAGRQRWVLRYLGSRGYSGATVRQIREATGWHHGQASAALSNLHKEGKIKRLAAVRDGCKVYVDLLCDFGRETEEHAGNARRSETDLLATARMLRAALAGVQPDYCVTHYTFFTGCRRCIAAKALRDTRHI